MTVYFEYNTEGPFEAADGVKTKIDRFQHAGGQYIVINSGVIVNDPAHRPPPTQSINMALEATFIDDPSMNQSYVALKTYGSLSAAAWQFPINESAAAFAWASEYRIQVKSDNSNLATIFNTFPKAEIDQTSVTDNIGYNAGGTFQDGLPSINAGVSWGTNITYNQKFYKTELVSHGVDNALWKVSLDGYRQPNGDGPYSRTDDELFWKNSITTSGSAYDNMWKISEIGGLPAYLFSPDMLAVIIADKTTDQYPITVVYEKYIDSYYLDRTFIAGVYKYHAQLTQNVGVVQYKQKFNVDWKNSRLVPID
ncbi:Leukocidin/Hemolysin toxin family protein [Thermoactinomyces sp. DSM 45891]|uniref:leukocidin family pore-forming toxin n=1 Tax=Thermoactinomyces sp. DSM 45891 TaxID=1761907 RepID=UPI000918AD96|nr:leukocidin family pore-forming toxin [Thermoactinomyces sp. DSM 45891]SFX64952.1 Leukocidin/Hemolysin toxin family protein [Thermoactinomyces sp. DSM 45891]